MPLLFNTIMYREYCKRKGIELEELNAGVMNGTAGKRGNFVDILLCAAENFVRYSGKQPAFSEYDAGDWIDAMGGPNSPELMLIYKEFVRKLLNIDPATFDVVWSVAQTGKMPEEVSDPGKKKELTEPQSL